MTNELITAGIDIGSSTAQAVVMQKDKILSFSNIGAGTDKKETALKVLDLALQGTGISQKDIKYVVGTGYGRYQVPFANKNVTEITCHARGAHHFFPKARTVLDMGGQDCKAISCDENGKVTAFVMNEKCAAGTGRSMEVIAKLFDVRLDDIGPMSLDIKEKVPQMGSSCVVFAKSEALRMLRGGVPRTVVLAAYCDALVHRILLLLQRIGVIDDLVISGGIAKNIGVVKRIETNLATKSYICFEPQIVGAVGAALIAQKLLLESSGDSRE
jgi:predicted CoA-substrate-specific enzyme activase